MATPIPRTIDEYLAQLRAALSAADPAFVQDALYDAEEHLRAEFADNPDKTEAEMLEKIVGSYGAPEEVASIYMDQEVQVQQALRSPPPPPRVTVLGRFFAIGGDPRAYAALFYMLLSLATGIIYFTWTVTGLSLSIGLSILVFGALFAVMFFGSVRILALVEGRMVEVMLGERMPRRPVYASQGGSVLRRIGGMFTDPRTWSTLLYFVLMLPLGIIYFTFAVVGLSLSISFVAAPIGDMLHRLGWLRFDGGLRVNGASFVPSIIVDPLIFVLGIALFFGLLHLARGVGRFQGALAKHLLVRSAL